MKRELEERLSSLFRRHPVLVGGPVPSDEIARLEAYFGHPLPDDYETFVRKFGGAIVGSYPIFGLRSAHPMGKNDDSAIQVTERYKAQGTPDIDEWLIISTNLSGSPIGLLPNGEIWIADCESNVIERLSPNFDTFLRDVCLKGS